MKRHSLAVAVLSVVTVGILYAMRANSDGEKAFMDTRWERRSDNWVRTTDTTCPAVAETLTGPSIYCFGAAQAMFRVQANSGTCSLMVVQVSNNDTNWIASGPFNGAVVRFAPSSSGVFIPGDSLNRGGVFAYIFPTLSATTDSERPHILLFRYARMIFTTRRGHDPGVSANTSPTTQCRSKLDSLRITGYIQRNAP